MKRSNKESDKDRAKMMISHRMRRGRRIILFTADVGWGCFVTGRACLSASDELVMKKQLKHPATERRTMIDDEHNDEHEH